MNSQIEMKVKTHTPRDPTTTLHDIGLAENNWTKVVVFVSPKISELVLLPTASKTQTISEKATHRRCIR
jgi:hypothetical protein